MGQRFLLVVGHRLTVVCHIPCSLSRYVRLILRICYCSVQKQRDNTIHSELDSFTVAVAVIRGFERGLFHTLLLIYAVVVSLV